MSPVSLYPSCDYFLRCWFIQSWDGKKTWANKDARSNFKGIAMPVLPVYCISTEKREIESQKIKGHTHLYLWKDSKICLHCFFISHYKSLLSKMPLISIHSLNLWRRSPHKPRLFYTIYWDNFLWLLQLQDQVKGGGCGLWRALEVTQALEGFGGDPSILQNSQVQFTSSV